MFKLSRRQSYSSLLDLKCNLQQGMEGNPIAKIIQPIDMMKLRIQLGLGSAGQVARTMIKEEGFGSLYKDLSNQPRLLQTQISEIKKRLSC
ncbi:mitochondrial dicarboxylate/tricarboxylate transporter DTC-like [Rosa rugosa]|uniref:mitochondrial dicarboxylate/tricarboxylate transporter DTC-like n=1 Tax=Rosa rugosa TaxID=74645 RepID=UPI002B400CAF|nr:mitochondrial dicarboxylate/tricarboxylate transporter DTC-like [Rosa rugosa]